MPFPFILKSSTKCTLSTYLNKTGIKISIQSQVKGESHKSKSKAGFAQL